MTKRINIFDTVANDAGSRIQSRDWYLKKIQELKKRNLVTKNKLISHTENITSTLEIGSLYMFVYDAKYKNVLPEWDAFPLVIPFSVGQYLFKGFNLHYLPQAVRWKFFKALLKSQDLSNIRRLSTRTTLNMEYAANIPILKQTIHSYLYTHIIPTKGGRYLKINPADWHFSVLLPVQDFRYASK